MASESCEVIVYNLAEQCNYKMPSFRKIIKGDALPDTSRPKRQDI